MASSRRRRALRIASALLAVGLLGCGPQTGEDGPLQGAVFVLFDTLRADHLSTADYARPTSPSLEALASRGVVFEQTISYSPWTLPSMLAILSGDWSDRPGVFAQGRLGRSRVQAFREAGIATGAFTEGAFVSRDFGFDLGFADYEEEEGAVQRLLPGELRDPNYKGSIERTFARARSWLAAHAHERFFLFVHTYEPHTPYRRRTFTDGLDPGSVGEVFETEELPLLRSGALHFDDRDLLYLTALYDGGVRESDRQLGELLELLEELGISGRTLVVVSSDHGEELGEHYPRAVGDHGHSLHDELLRVPLVIANPTERYPVARISAQVRTIDILPTIAELMGVADADGAGRAGAGRSLVPLLRGEERDDRIAFGGATRTLPARSFVRSGGYKYIESRLDSPPDPELPAPPPRQLYDLRADPGERTNLVDAQPELADRLREQLREHEAGREQQIPALDAIPPALQERLRSLGYL